MRMQVGKGIGSVYNSVGIPESRQTVWIFVRFGEKTTSIARFRPRPGALMLSKHSIGSEFRLVLPFTQFPPKEIHYPQGFHLIMLVKHGKIMM